MTDSKNTEIRILEGVEYRRTTRKHWEDAQLLRADWIKAGFRVRVEAISEEHARTEPGGERLLISAWRPVEEPETPKVETVDLGNNESTSRGVFAQSDGTFLAMTFTRSKRFKTRKGAENWFRRATGEG